MEPSGCQVWSLTLALVTISQIIGFTHGMKAAKPCYVRSTNCLTSVQLTAQQEGFICPHRGHFLYPGDHFRYYRCLTADSLPCLCWCRYRQMCFDANTGRCGFAFLTANCSSSASTTRQPITSKPTTPLKVQLKHPGYISKDNGTYDLSYRFKHQKTSHSHHDDIGGHGARPRSYNHARQDVLTAQELILSQRQLAIKGKMKDVSVFPAWAVAAIVLCIVMILVLMAIFLY